MGGRRITEVNREGLIRPLPLPLDERIAKIRLARCVEASQSDRPGTSRKRIPMLRLRQPRPLFFLTSTDLVLRSIVCSGVISSCSSLPPHLLHRVQFVDERNRNKEGTEEANALVKSFLPPLTGQVSKKERRARENRNVVGNPSNTRLDGPSFPGNWRVKQLPGMHLMLALSQNFLCSFRKTPHSWMLHTHTIRVYRDVIVEINI